MQPYDQGDRYSYKHEEGRHHATKIAHSDVGQYRTNKVQGQANAGDDAKQWPNNAENQAYGTNNLADRQQWKVTQRHTDDLMNRLNLARISTKFHDA